MLGSINMDLVARCDVLPLPGETRTAASFAEVPGGKGANQAVAASRAGGRVVMIGRVGDDGFGRRLVDDLQREQVHCDLVHRSAGTPSGLAMIAVADSGENQILVVPGANGLVSRADVDRGAEQITRCDMLLVQLEVPLATVVYAIQIARAAGVRVILDPAPAPRTDPPAALFDVDLICPNETEAAALTGRVVNTLQDAEAAARQLHDSGSKAVAITLGDRGTMLFDGNTISRIDPVPVTAVDSTAAGDAFAGAAAVRWVDSHSLHEAVRWGNVAGAIAASRHGAQSSLPTRAEIEQRAARHFRG